MKAPLLRNYGSVIFDCDGVVLNSNKLKTEAFTEVASKYSDVAAQRLTDFHVENGGISRYVKFRYLAETILGLSEVSEIVSALVDEYSQIVAGKLLSCEMTSALPGLQLSTVSKWAIVSGGKQTELIDLFNQRGIDSFFELGIFGSPSSKNEIVNGLKDKGLLVEPVLFIGDSKHDFEVAHEHGMDFVFISGWTEFKGWKEFCICNEIPYLNSLEALLELQEAADGPIS